MSVRTLFSLVFALALSANAYASPDALKQRAQSLENHVSQYSESFTSSQLDLKSKSIAERLNQGIILQASGDLERAGYVYMDILSHDSWRHDPAYVTASLNLAQTLFGRGYYRLAEQQCAQLISENPASSERNEAVTLLIQCVQKTENWDAVIDVLKRNGATTNDPALQYALGRSLFLQNRDSEAMETLDSIRDSGEWGVKTTYIKGVLYIRSNDLESAKTMFKTVSVTSDNFKRSDEIRILSDLALARIAYEENNWSEAISYYQRIPETSPYFGDVLYEMAWTHIRLEDYTTAKQTFELLVMNYPKHRRALETNHFLAGIEKELGHYDVAMNSYQQLVGKYEPIMNKMKADANNIDAKRRMIEEQVQKGEYDSIELLPEEARDSFAKDEHVTRVENVLGSLEQSDTNTEASERIIAEIENIIQSPENIRSLPQFRKMSNNVRDLLLEATYLGTDIMKEYNRNDKDLSGELMLIDSLPRTQQERDIIASKQMRALEDRSSRFHRLQLEATNTQHRLEIVQTWMKHNNNDSLSQEEREQLTAQLQSIESRIQALKTTQQSIETEIEKLRLSSVNGSTTDTTEAVTALNELYTQLISQWKSDLTRPNLDSNYRAIITQMLGIFENITSLQNELDLAVNAKLEDLNAQLSREKRIVAEEKARYNNTREDVSRTAGDLAASFWSSVYSQIRDLVMDADLGMVDIAWIRKDARTQELNDVIEERKKERDVLQQDFKQYLNEKNEATK